MSSGAGGRRLGPGGARAIAVAAPAVAAIALSLLVLSSRRTIEAELQLEAEPRALAGEPLPLRARLYEGLSRIEGPSLATAPTRVELLASDGEALGHAWLHPGQWVAQRKFDAVPMECDAGEMFPCVGVYTVDGRAAGAYGRVAPRPLIDWRAQDTAVMCQ